MDTFTELFNLVKVDYKIFILSLMTYVKTNEIVSIVAQHSYSYTLFYFFNLIKGTIFLLFLKQFKIDRRIWPGIKKL